MTGTTVKNHRHKADWNRCRRPRRERGIVLFVSLILLLILTLLGVTVARMQTGEERMAQNDLNHQNALQAAEAAARFAESNILQGIYVQALFYSNANGLYYLAPTAGSVVDTMNWSVPGAATITYNGPAIGNMTLSSPPIFLIELWSYIAGSGKQANMEGYGTSVPTPTVYRITAHGYGGDTTSGATVQTIFQ